MASPEARDTEYLKAAYERLKAYHGRIPASGRLLDVGCGCGAFVAMAEAAGYDANGLEPGVEQVKIAQRLGRNVVPGGWEDIKGSADAITLLDVFEHLPDPSGCLYHLKQHLTPRGVLIVEFPEWGCPKAREEGLKWRHVKPLQHLFLPDEQAARTLFVRNGLRVVTVDRPCRGGLSKITFFLESA
jgi:2-polyprenyl-3-methyl-5-hydroxy-6-metoxy-1,4-benzoquinol methylase